MIRALAVAAIAGGALTVVVGSFWWWGAAGALLALSVAAVWVRVWWRSPHPLLERIQAIVFRQAASQKTVTKWGDQSRAQAGLASKRDARLAAGERRVLAKAGQVRPSLTGGPVTASQVGLLLCRVAAQELWASLEDVVLIFGGPRTGKTGWMSARLTAFDGPAVSISTRKDLYVLTVAARRERGPVWVFNAAGFGGIDVADECAFNPLEGCTSSEVARARACDMIPAPESGDDAQRWASMARDTLGLLMHAAAIGGHTMDDVLQWAAAPQKHSGTVTKLLRRSPNPGAATSIAEQFFENNDRTRSSITTSIMPALQWLQSTPARRAAGLDGAHLHTFRTDDLLATGGTVYILGLSDEHTHVTPLMAALGGHIASVARDAARHTDTGRIDPALGLLIDEAAKVALPLPSMSADVGGTGICLVGAFQSHADMVDVWGKQGAARLMNNAAAKLLAGRNGDLDDLRMWADLIGQRDETVHTTDADGRVTSSTVRSVDVLSPAQISQLPPQTVVAFCSGMRPAIGRIQMGWEDDPAPVRRRRWVTSRLPHPPRRRVAPHRVTPTTPVTHPAPAEREEAPTRVHT